MSALSNYIENKLVDSLLRGQSFPVPTTLYFALCSEAPAEDGTLVELSGGGYARVSVTASLANFSGTQGASSADASSGASGTSYNIIEIVFPTATAAWGTASHVAVMDADTSGNLIMYGALTRRKNITSGMSPKFKPGAVKFVVDDVT